MTDKNNRADTPEPLGDAAPAPDPAFPSVAFACPACGQMLAPTCRVCVACRQPIDPAKITLPRAEASALNEALRTGISPKAIVRFPWPLFIALLFARILAAGLINERLGLVKAELILLAFELACAVWVFYDAGRGGVPMPFRWAWGTLLLWPIVFPWYLVRRRAPRAACPFVEGIALPILLVVLLALGFVLALIVKIPNA